MKVMCQNQKENPVLLSDKSGFTMLELLVVISIIAILVGILIPTFTNIKKGAKVKKATADVTAISVAIRGYHLELHKWPGNYAGGIWSFNNWQVINDLANNGKRIYFEANGTLSQPVLDPFGSNITNNSYRIRIEGDSVTVWSCGPDGMDGSGDEISVSN